jgi:hypothetical protein
MVCGEGLLFVTSQAPIIIYLAKVFPFGSGERTTGFC